MREFDTLQKVVDQLKSCGFTCEAGSLENNLAFIALESYAKHGMTGWTDGTTDTRQVLVPMTEYNAFSELLTGSMNLLSALESNPLLSASATYHMQLMKDVVKSLEANGW